MVQAILPLGLKRFDKIDWESYSGCSNLPDGSDPVIGEVMLPEGTGNIVVAGNDDGKVQVSIFRFPDVGNGLDLDFDMWTRSMDSVEDGLWLASLLARAPFAINASIMRTVGLIKI